MSSPETAHWAIVEDSDEDFAAFSRVFRGESAVLERWTTGEAALVAFNGGGTDLHAIAVMIVDLHLPGIDGCEVIERTRALDGGSVPMICMLTSSTIPADRERAQASGADGYLVKPDDLAGLRALPAEVADMVARRAA